MLGSYEKALESGRFLDGLEVLRRALRAVEASPPAGRRDGPTFSRPSPSCPPSSGPSSRSSRPEGSTTLAPDPPDAWKGHRAGSAPLPRDRRGERDPRNLPGDPPRGDPLRRRRDPLQRPRRLSALSSGSSPASTTSRARSRSGFAVSYTPARPGRARLPRLDRRGFRFRRAAPGARLRRADVLAPGRRRPDAPGTRGAARALRDAGIGWGRERHLACLDRLVGELEKPEERSRTPTRTSRTISRRRRRGEHERAISSRRGGRATSCGAPSRSRRVRRRLERHALPRRGPRARSSPSSATRPTSSTARPRTALDALFEEFIDLCPRVCPSPPPSSVCATRSSACRSPPTVRAREGARRPLPRRRILRPPPHVPRRPGRGPRAGARPRGSRPARRGAPAHQRGIGARRLLALGRDRPREAAAAFWACLGSLRGKLTASYPSFDLRNLSQAGEPAASPAFLDLLPRALGPAPSADYADLARRASAGRRLRAERGGGAGRIRVVASPVLRHAGGAGRDARLAAGRARRLSVARGRPPRERPGRSEEFTVWDGWVRGATPELDPRAGRRALLPFARCRTSPKCPFAYFVRHVLRVEEPKDLERDPDPLARADGRREPPPRSVPGVLPEDHRGRREAGDGAAPRD